MKKRFFSIILVAILLCSISIPAFATSGSECSQNREAGQLISMKQFDDEYGNHIVERIYFTPVSGSDLPTISSNGSISPQADKSGAGWYKKEDTISGSNGNATMYVKAYFVWGNGDVSVSDPSTGIIGLSGSSITVSNQKVTTGTEKLFGIKYAYAQYTFTTTNMFGISKNNKVRISVSQNGDVS